MRQETEETGEQMHAGAYPVTWNPQEVDALQEMAQRAVRLARGIDALVERGVLTGEAAQFLAWALAEGRHIGVVATNAAMAGPLVETFVTATGCALPDRGAGLWQVVLGEMGTARGALYVMDATCACHALRGLIKGQPDPEASGERLSAWLDLVVDIGTSGRVERIAAVTGPLNGEGLPNRAIFAREGGVLRSCTLEDARVREAAI